MFVFLNLYKRKIGSIIILIQEMEKLRHTEVNKLAQDHRAKKWKSGDFLHHKLFAFPS